jgi:hypothetical protein
MLTSVDDIFVSMGTSYKTKDFLLATILPSTGNTKDNKTIQQERQNANGNKFELHKNIPIPGFVIERVTKKTFGAYNNSWLLIDPRGFAFLLGAENMERIMSKTAINNGVINSPCVWIRTGKGKDLYLVTEDDEYYKTAKNNTEVLANKPSKREVKFGATVQLASGEVGRYLGSYYLHKCSSQFTYRSVNETLEMVTTGRREIFEIALGKYLHRTKHEIVKILDESNICTKDEAFNYLQTMLLSNPGTCVFSPYTTILSSFPNYSSEMIKYISQKSTKVEKMEMIEIPKDEALDLLKLGATTYDRSILVLERNGVQYVVKHVLSSYARITPVVNPDNLPVSEITGFGKSSITFVKGSKSESFDNFDTYYKVVKVAGNSRFL